VTVSIRRCAVRRVGRAGGAPVDRRYDDEGGTTVIDGPFTEAKELVGGFWILQVSSRAEALEWMRKAPFRGEEVEVRQVFETSDFGDAMTPELAAAEDRVREMVTQQQRGS